MNDAIYTLVLRADASFSSPAPRADLLAHLLRIPGVEAVDPAASADLYRFGDDDEHGRMTLELFVVRNGERVEPAAVTDGESERCDGVEVKLPRAWVMERGPRVFALVFMLADFAKWEVFDPQIEDTLQKEAVLSGLVAMRQAQRDHEGRNATAPVSEPGTAASPTRPDQAPPTGEAYVPRAQDPASGRDTKPRKKSRPWWKKLGG